MHRWQPGFTLLELALVTLIVAVLFTVALNRLLDLMVDTERVHMLQIEGGIKSALGLELSRRIVERELSSIGNLQDSNPMTLLQDAPHNYVGEIELPDLSSQAAGVWLFDSTRHILIYLVRNTDAFHTELPGRARAEYRLQLTYDDHNHNGRFDYPLDRLSGVQLTTLARYRWQVQSD